MIAKYHQDICTGASSISSDEYSSDPITVYKTQTENLTRRKLIKQDDYKEWEAAEKQQMNLYETQGMFSKPTKLPNEHGINVLEMIWVYLVKTCGMPWVQ